MRGVPSRRWEAKPKFTKEYFAMQTTERKAVREMKAQGVQHFLVVYALVSDLLLPRLQSAPSTGEDSNLARAAARYNVDVTKLPSDVRGELAKDKAKKAKPSAKSPNKTK
jgi:hypothetical protein